MNVSRLTATSMGSMRRCPRLYFYRYELGLSRVRKATPLRFGSAFHRGLELYNDGLSSDLVVQSATADYETCPDWADPTAWAVECETIRALLNGHFWRYENDDIEHVAVEQSFEIPLINPATGAASRTFRLAGKMDGIVRLSDGRLAVLEYKTAGEDISPNSEYWLRLRCDGQISMYFLAARAIGHDVATVLYDVTRKPTIRLRKNETPEQFGERLLEDIGERPDYYYQRREVPRLEDELALFQAELWQQADLIRENRNRSRWFRNVSKLTCGFCQFADLCLNGITITPDSPPPSGFEYLDDVHPELTREQT